jgi:histone H3/H4
VLRDVVIYTEHSCRSVVLLTDVVRATIGKIYGSGALGEVTGQQSGGKTGDREGDGLWEAAAEADLQRQEAWVAESEDFREALKGGAQAEKWREEKAAAAATAWEAERAQDVAAAAAWEAERAPDDDEPAEWSPMAAAHEAAIEEIHAEQSCSPEGRDRCVPFLAFFRFVVAVGDGTLQYEPAAIRLLHDLADHFLVKLIEDANLRAIHSKRVVVLPADFLVCAPAALGR